MGSVRAEVSLGGAWGKIAAVQTNEARIEFESIRAAGGEDAREASMGVALALLNTQPKTEANFDRASSLLSEVAAEAPDDLGAWAMYYRARIEQVHRVRPNKARARELFAELIDQAPTSRAAQNAVVKRALIDLYGGATDERPRDTIATLEAIAPTLTDTAARRDLHLLLAEAAARLVSDREAALRHLLAADEIGILGSKSRADTWVEIGGLARELGHLEVADEYDARFVAEFPRDNRNSTVRWRLEEPSNLETTTP